ncbi:MAG: hypothetical protein Q8M31_23565 [Beijerinckiaceae bacterium]|nr:hypothetical protein [Beijerinckiaceae bacterium]
MALVKIRTPIVVFFDGAYRCPGTEIEVEEVEARRLHELHGTVDEDISISAADRASVDSLNKFHAINSVDNG